MAGYSGTPLAEKLGIKAGHRVALVNAPVGFEGQLDGLPDGVKPSRGMRGTAALDVIVCFTKSQADLNKRFAGLAKRLVPNGGFWIAWPKRASGVATDVNENDVRRIGLKAGLVDNKICAVDAIWSGLRFVYRVKDRPTTKSMKRN